MNKNIKKIIFIALVFIAASYMFTRFYESQFFLWEAKNKWGHDNMQAIKFKQSVYAKKSSMAYMAVSTQYAISWKREKLIKALGPDETDVKNYSRWYDKAVTYKIETNDINPWRLAFYYNQRGEVVRVRIEKKIYTFSFYSTAIDFIFTPFKIIYYVAQRMFMIGWARGGFFDGWDD